MRKSVMLAFVMVTANVCHAREADSAAFYFSKAKQFEEQRRWTDAGFNYLKAAGFDPGNYAIQESLGNYYMLLSKYPEAKVVFEKLHSVKPADTLVLHQLATLSFNLKKYEEAIRYYTELNKLSPSEATDIKLGIANRETEDYGQAILHFQHALQLNPRNAFAAYELGRAYVESDDYKKAIPLYEQAIGLDPSKYNWAYELGLLYFGENKFYDAIAWFQKALLAGMPKDLTWLENLGSAQLGTREYETGIATLEQVLLKKPNNPAILYTIAQSYYQHQEYKKAIEYWEKTLAADPKNYRAMYMQGVAYQKSGKTAKGRELCDKAIFYDPSLAQMRREKFNF